MSVSAGTPGGSNACSQTSPFTRISSINSRTDAWVKTTKSPSSRYEFRAQSSRLLEDDDSYDVDQVNSLLTNDFKGRATIVTELSLGFFFADSAFGFAVNDPFISNFKGTFLNDSCLIDTTNFKDDDHTCVFLNRMISTITHFLHFANKPALGDIRPLRYFSALHSNKPVHGSAMKWKPDMMLLRLVDGCIIEGGPLYWHDAQGFIEQTCESKVPIRMTETIISKAYLTFCAQPERDFIINVCITSEDFRVVMMDHAGSVETKPISFANILGTIYFFQTVMGLAFLPDKCLGVDTTIIRHNSKTSSGTKFLDQYEPYASSFSEPIIDIVSSKPLWCSDPLPIAVSTTPGPDGFDKSISSISIDNTVYRVISILFKSPSLIGRSTKAYLVQHPDGTQAVVKDSWITTDRPPEATVLKGLTIPFGPDLLQSTILRNTDDLRKHVFNKATINESRQKRRVAIYPAGVHISDFTSLWELMVAFLDIVIAILYLETKNKVHRDISYTNVLLREPGQDPEEKQQIKANFCDQLDLSGIESLRKNLGCREGLLVDYDYAAELFSSRQGQDREGEGNGNEADVIARDAPNFTNVSGVRTGTPPFIAVELLLLAVPHRVVHDLESVFYVLLFICTHLAGPHAVCDPPLYGVPSKQSHPSHMRHWFTADNLVVLGNVKSNHMFLYFEEYILPHISPYFQPLVPYLEKIWSVLHPQRTEKAVAVGRSSCHSTATCRDIIDVLKSALLDKELIDQARKSKSILGKRAHPGDLTSAPNGWDAAKVSKGLLRGRPYMKSGSSSRRSSAVMSKQRRGGGPMRLVTS